MGVLGGRSGAWHGEPLCPQPAQLLPLPMLREHTQRPENLPVKWRALSCLYHTLLLISTVLPQSLQSKP